MTTNNRSGSLLEIFSWEKLIIWGIFLGILYILRNFFSIIFLTFILSYIMRTFVVWFCSYLPPGRYLRFFQPVFTFVSFLVLLYAVYGLGQYIVPTLTSQGQTLVTKLASPEKGMRSKVDELLRDSIGHWLVYQAYGDSESAQYQSALNAWAKNSNLAQDQLHAEFETSERNRLLSEWKQGEIANKLEQEVQTVFVEGAATVGGYLREAIPRILVLPFQIGLILLLSFFIVVDVPRLSKGIARLKESRVSHFYHEIAPGLISFGRLIGRSFLAQGVIAIVNTILTLAVIRLLGIQNEVFLCTIVFLCSFIPVVGVVFSSIPIAMMAITQEGGTIALALWAIFGILVVHFIETSLLNPKIVGDMLHLHPVLVLAILAIGEHFFGVWGLLLGVPIMVYIIRFVILDEGIPGIIEPIRSV